MAYDDLTPSNRFEMALSGDMTAEEASNRLEKILAGADIEPSNRLEYFLKLRVSEGGGGGGSALEHGTFTPTERTQEHTFTTEAEHAYFLLFVEHGFNLTSGSASVVEIMLENGNTESAIGTNNSGNGYVPMSYAQGHITQAGNQYTYHAQGTGDTDRMLQAGFTYGWFAWD